MRNWIAPSRRSPTSCSTSTTVVAGTSSPGTRRRSSSIRRGRRATSKTVARYRWASTATCRWRRRRRRSRRERRSSSTPTGSSSAATRRSTSGWSSSARRRDRSPAAPTRWSTTSCAACSRGRNGTTTSRSWSARLEPVGADVLDLRLPADREGLRQMRARLGVWLSDLGAEPDVRNDVLLAVVGGVRERGGARPGTGKRDLQPPCRPQRADAPPASRGHRPLAGGSAGSPPTAASGSRSCGA